MVRPLQIGGTMASIRMISAVVALVAAGEAAAEPWPVRPVTMVVPFAAGGSQDVFGRVLAPRLAELLGQPVVIENIGGAGGMTGTARVAKAAADGYQFVYGNIGTHAHNQTLYKHPLYNAATDFAPVALIAETASVLVTRKDLPVTDLPSFIAYAKAHQKELQFGSAGAGSPPHLACVLLNAAIGVSVTHIPYRSGGQAIQDLMAGRNDYQCLGFAISLPQIEGNLVKPIVTLSRDRSPLMPALASAHEHGLTDFDITNWTAMFLPKGTPQTIVRKLHRATAAALETPSVQQRLKELGASVVTPERRSPEYLQKFVESEIAKWALAIKAAGVAAD
jgi:tripartite-type tricarboxylate transporter receptor subunit TctC